MCRLLIILDKLENQNIYLERFLRQSIQKKFTPGLDNDRDFNFHKDGYGLILKFNENFFVYKSPKVYTEDSNIDSILSKISNSKIIIGHIRSIKTEINDNISYFNTHPFFYLNNYWLHNGSIKPFERKFFEKFISRKYINCIKGNTDSEVLMYVFLTKLDHYRNSLKAWKEFFNLLTDLNKENIVISANIIYLNNNMIYVSRYINNDEIPPSLYFDDKSLILSSEPVSDNFTLVEKNIFFRWSLKSKTLKKLKM